MLDDVKCIEKNPERVRRIRETPVSERIPGKQVAELVVNLGLRHGQPRQQRHPRENRDTANGRYGDPLVSCELGELLLHPGQNWLAQSWLGPEEQQTDRKNNPVYGVHGGFNHIPQEMHVKSGCFSSSSRLTA
jgi:hypothetical protein